MEKSNIENLNGREFLNFWKYLCIEIVASSHLLLQASLLQ